MMCVLVTGGPAWAVGCLAVYTAFDNSLAVYTLDGETVFCNAKEFRYE